MFNGDDIVWSLVVLFDESSSRTPNVYGDESFNGLRDFKNVKPCAGERFRI